MFPPDLPPVSNRALYAYRVMVKWFSFFLFGLGTLILIAIVFPPMRIFLHSAGRFKKYGRRLVSFTMRIFVLFMQLTRALDLKTKNRENLRYLSSKIIVANHPSLLDVVMLLSLIPNADCIVNARLNRTIVRGIISQLYIPNSSDFEEIMQACTESLKLGNCLIIFPEGTRTPRSGKAILKKGAARIALVSGCKIVTVHIGGTDKFGLGKRDPWTGFNPRDRYVYDINMASEIDPEKYRNYPVSKAARLLTDEMAVSLFPEKQAENP